MSGSGEKATVFGLGAAVLAVVCCAVGPLLVASVGSVALGAWLGSAAGAVFLVAATVAVLVRRRSRTPR